MAVLTKHARRRMNVRRISEDDVRVAVDLGRTFFARHAVIKVIGRKEIAHHDVDGEMAHLDGLHVILSHNGCVITTYRNRHFRKADFRKPKRHRVRFI